MKILAVIVSSLCAAGFAFGQIPATEKPPLPLGAIIAKLPDWVAWNVVYRAPKKPEESRSEIGGASANAQSTDEQKQEIPRIIAVVKTGDVAKIIETDTGGQSRIRWYYSSRVFEAAESGKWRISTGNVGLPGFSDFNWVSAKNYIGVGIVENQSCFIFQDLIRIPDAEEPILAKAAIGMKSRLPVQLLIGGTDSQMYEFPPPPNQALIVPAGIVSLYAEQKKVGEALMRRPK